MNGPLDSASRIAAAGSSAHTRIVGSDSAEHRRIERRQEAHDQLADGQDSFERSDDESCEQANPGYEPPADTAQVPPTAATPAPHVADNTHAGNARGDRAGATRYSPSTRATGAQAGRSDEGDFSQSGVDLVA
jgi:hypothetical protein